MELESEGDYKGFMVRPNVLMNLGKSILNSIDEAKLSAVYSEIVDAAYFVAHVLLIWYLNHAETVLTGSRQHHAGLLTAIEQMFFVNTALSFRP